MDPTNKAKGPSPHYSLYQREVFKLGGTQGILPDFSVHSEELVESTKKKLNDRGYFYANSNAGLGWTDRANREAFYRWRIIPRMLVDTNVRDLSIDLFGHRIPAPVLFAPIGINKLYTPKGELVPAKIAGELGIPYCLSTASSQPIEAVAEANDLGASEKNESNSVHSYNWSQRRWCEIAALFPVTISLLERAWKSGFDVCMLTVDTWQLGWRPTDINLANYVFYYPGAVGNEVGTSDPVFMRKHGKDLERDSGKWIDSSVWHGKAHTWEKIPWLIKEVCRLVSWGRIPILTAFLASGSASPMVAHSLSKGIQSAQDALKAYEIGCEGIIVTNHAGRQVDGAVGSLEVLPEIVEAVEDKMTIIFDSGVRTGSDIFKAIALGAHAGMAHEGEKGCRHVLKSLLAVRFPMEKAQLKVVSDEYEQDLDITMTVAGYPAIKENIHGKHKDILKYNESGVYPKGEHAKL
ncbi:hypothetical protein VNI00_014975 [Paramarasmius palmivorus]|uniref:FMN hydroxy acid dehydrogenase domain-containing protein n=1 Tax=Paramarasmius palmivorus TaxID=297713 RepID=A0AAW0BNR7_9AGAR